MNPDIDTARLATAWDWVLRLREDGTSQQELAEWLAWYEADDRNREAFEEMQAFWRQSDRVAEEPEPLSPELWLGTPLLAKAAASTRTASHRHGGLGGLLAYVNGPGWSWPAAGISAAVLASAAVALLMMLPPAGVVRTTALQETTISAAPGPGNPVSEATLPDGSTVQLAQNSAVSLQFTAAERRLEMKSQGVAYFTVAHQRQRPFLVEVGSVVVRAVGTAFNVRNTGDRVVVTVAEGKVDVYPLGGSATADAVRVEAGKEVAWSTRADSPAIAEVDAAHALAWREGRLDYLNEPLSSAIADINRYSRHPVRIRDPEIGHIVFSGTVMTDATDDWIHSLPSLFPVDVEHEPDGGLALVKRTRG